MSNKYNQSHASVLLEKLIVTQLVAKFPAFYETQRFIIVFTRDQETLCIFLP